MIPGEVYTKNQIDKLGNTLIFLCERMGAPLTKTHLLKLIFIIEEISIKKYGIPFFDLRFDVWKLGPVSKDLFVELSGEPNLLSDYVTREISNDKVMIVAKARFSDDEFNDLEISLLEEIVERFKYCTAKELINVTHRKDSPWYKTAQKNGVLDLLESGVMTTTDIPIDLSETIIEDLEKMALYKGHKEFLNQSRNLKF
ncbi:Panacea domain-containing protein [Foetidibacter luteolus]|uniref:Panacea domain-containing protein n=1 Tax=Foetidibacter luteolus TaxID=2608880 RepID=UPI00129B7BC3|nr:Panacea domain-containing protein [Foetidibacter luteolus]